MTLVQLRHLIALADSGSFSKSATASHLTQPALSRSIRALEDELGMPLFDRIGRHTELTAFGRGVVERARHLVFEADDLRAAGGRLRQGKSGHLRVGMGSGPAALLMTPLLLEAAKLHPALRVDIARGNEALVPALRARTLDAVIVDARTVAPAPDLRFEPLPELPGAFMCRRGHPLARKKDVPFSALQAYPIASTPLSDEVARMLLERYGPQAHPQQCVNLRCEDIASLVAVAQQSDTVVLAIRAAGIGLAEIKTLPLLKANARLSLITLAGRSETPALAVVRSLIQRIVPRARR
jgi:DNA-binding transcriptional LysR family regulator